MSEGASHSPMSVAVGAAAAVAVGGLLFGAYRKARAQGRRVLTISVPATTANLGCGFDAFGAALDMYMTLRAEVAANQSATSFTYEGEGANEVALDESNMIWKSAIACQTMWAPGRRMPKLAVHVRNSVPFGRGLGSSATAIIAGVMLANEFLDLSLTKDQLLDAALEIESHPDNLSAALYGGATCSLVSESGKSMVRAYPISRAIRAIVVVPDFQLATSKAREVLPKEYSLADVVFNVQRAALLPMALSEAPINHSFIRECMKDRIHQNQRAPLVPGLEECLWLPSTLGNPKLLAMALSGAGPTIIGLCTGDYNAIGNKMIDTLRVAGVQSKSYVMNFTRTGATATWSLF